MNISQNPLERSLNICNTIADYENILVIDIRMEKNVGQNFRPIIFTYSSERFGIFTIYLIKKLQQN